MKLRLLSLVSAAALVLTVGTPLARAFDPNVNGYVYASLVQSDGKVVIGGSFTQVQPTGETAPVDRARLARFNADGSLDLTLDIALDGDVTALAVQTDGRILVGGNFTQARVGSTGAVHARSGLLRLAADGSLDLGFDPRPQGAPASAAQVSAIAIESTGTIVIGGAFTALQPGGAGAPVARQRLARLNADGSVDTAFTPAANNVVFGLAVQADGRIAVAGGFTTIQPAGSDTAVEASRFARLERDGTLDAGFKPTLNNRALALALDTSGNLIVGGDFTLARGNSDASDIARYYVARFLPSGELDTTFSPRANGAVAAIGLQRDGKVLLGGSFTSISPASGVATLCNYVARLDALGGLDGTFVVNLNGAVRTLALQGDNKVILGGFFTRVTPSGSTGSVQRNHVARVSASGDLEGTFGDTSGQVLTAALEADGSLVIGGTFTTINGVTRTNLARLLPGGALDADFHPAVDGSIYAVAVQADGKLLVGGQFTEVAGESRKNLVRLNRDGTVDTGFNPGPNSTVSALLVLADGRILVGGSFTTFDLDDGQGDDDDSDGTSNDDTTRTYFAELTAAGTLTSVNVELNGAINAIVRQSDGRILLGGSFTSVGEDNRYGTARLSATYQLVADYQPNPSGTVQAVVVQPDGKIVIGGAITLLQYGVDSTDDDITRSRIARLNSDGTIDGSLNPGLNGNVAGLLVTTSNQILVGGNFTQVETPAVTRNHLLRIGSDGALDTGFSVQTDDRVAGLVAGSDGAVYVFGRFTRAYDSNGTALPTPGHVLRLTAAGAIDQSYAVTTTNAADEAVLALAPEAGGRIVVGGRFASFAGRTTANLARVYSGGTPDASFTAETDGPVHALLNAPQTLTSEARINLLSWFESAGGLRTSFDRGDLSNLVGSINAVITDGDAILVGGSFTVVGSTIKNLARFSRTGVLDRSFNPAPDAKVTALGRQSDGKIVVGGSFANIGGVERAYFARLNADGSADPAFAPPALNAAVSALVVQSDGAIVIGGLFTAVEVNDGQNDDDDGDATTTDDTGRHYIARFQADGTLDTVFDPNAGGEVNAILLLSDGRMILGGSFLSLQPNGGSAYTRNYVGMINSTGTVVDSFNPGASGVVRAIARQADGKILLGGDFVTLLLDDGEGDDDNGNGTTTDDADRRYLARLNADFTLDAAFDPRPYGPVKALAVDTAGRIYVGGTFTAFDPAGDDTNEVGRSRLARLLSDGTIDEAFIPTANDAVNVILCLADDSVIAAGAFTNILAEFPVYVGGEFSTIGDAAITHLARLDENGLPDSTFAPAPNGTVHALAADASGRILVAGAFTQIAGAARSRIARFNRDGSLDSLAPAVDGTVRALATGPSGTIFIGGEFSSVGGASAVRLARLSDSGAIDAGYAPQFNGMVHAVAVLPDGRALVAGAFTTVNGGSYRYLVRLLANGTVDPAFNPAPDAPVYALSLRSDGTVLAGGEFAQIGGQSRARLAVLKADGTPDATFTATANGTVWSAAGMLDGTTVIGGAFTSTASATAHLINRVSGTGSATYSFSVGSGLNSATWTLSGATPVFSSVSFAYSTNGNSWTILGSGSATSDGKSWSWSGTAQFPANTAYLLRVRAVLPVAQGGSSGVVEEMWQFVNTTAAGTITITQVPSEGSGGSSGPGGSGSTGGGLTSSLPAGATVTTAYGSTTNRTAVGYITDFATLLRLKGSEVQYVNFVIAGNAARRIYLRAAGPGLAAMAIADRATAPRFELYTAAGAMWLKAQGPVTDSSVRSLADQLGALAIGAVDADAATVTTLYPGAYTLAVWDGAGTGGAVLVELYETDGMLPSGLVAFSSRASDAANDGAQTVEFTLKGFYSRTVLVRALGPALVAQGLGGALADPKLALQNAEGTTLVSNDNWETAVAGGTITAATASALSTAATTVGGVALAAGSRDAAILATLTPGTYTVAVTGPAGATGFSEVEIFELPAEDTSSSSTSSSSSSSTSSSSSSSGGGGAPTPAALALLSLLLMWRGWRRPEVR